MTVHNIIRYPTKKIEEEYDINFKYFEDCVSLCDTLARSKFFINPEQAFAFWKWHSDDWSAGWLFLDTNDVVLKYFAEYTKKIENGEVTQKDIDEI